MTDMFAPTHQTAGRATYRTSCTHSGRLLRSVTHQYKQFTSSSPQKPTYSRSLKCVLTTDRWQISLQQQTASITTWTDFTAASVRKPASLRQTTGSTSTTSYYHHTLCSKQVTPK